MIFKSIHIGLLVVFATQIFSSEYDFTEHKQKSKPIVDSTKPGSANDSKVKLDNYCKSLKAQLDKSDFSGFSGQIRSALNEFPENKELLELKKSFVIKDYNANVLNAGSVSKLFDKSPDIKKCQSGNVSQEANSAIIKRINYLRRLAGIYDSCVLDPVLNKKAQFAAHMMEANNTLSHAPKSTWKCYNKDGADAASKSNLSLGYGFLEALMGQIEDDGAGNHACGHRRWILNPDNNVFGHGSTNESMCLYTVSTYNKSLSKSTGFKDTQFIAWPSKDYFPQDLVPVRWSFSLKDADFSAAQVGVTSDGKSIKLSKEKLEQGYAVNTLVWSMSQKTEAGKTYVVKISNVKVYSYKLGKNVTKSFQYQVTTVK